MPDLSETDDSLREVLLTHRGPDNAITSGELAKEVGINDSPANPSTRFSIRRVIESTGLPVGASANGYFVIESRRQLRDYVDQLRGRQRGIERRIRKVRAAYNDELSQMTLSEAVDDA